MILSRYHAKKNHCSKLPQKSSEKWVNICHVLERCLCGDDIKLDMQHKKSKRQKNSDQTLFIVTTKASMAIKDALPNAHIHMRAYDISSVESYGTYSYFRLTVERLSAQNELIQNGVNVVVIEADAYWSSGNICSLIHTYLSQDYDIVSADNGHDATMKLVLDFWLLSPQI